MIGGRKATELLARKLAGLPKREKIKKPILSAVIRLKGWAFDFFGGKEIKEENTRFRGFHKVVAGRELKRMELKKRIKQWLIKRKPEKNLLKR